MNYSLIIPARYDSSRLPGKPLVLIEGRPIIVRTWQQCIKACDPALIYVATDDERVEGVCREHGIQVLITSSECLTGTDRIAECAQQLDADLFIDVQGDEPVFNPEDISSLISAAKRWPGTVINGYCDLKTDEEYYSTQVPKVVFTESGRLIYMSRGTIPGNIAGKRIKGWRQVCAYSFPREALMRFAEQKNKTPLEAIEDIEILRFLELGFEVKMIRMSDESIPVDYPEDVDKVERRLTADLGNGIDGNIYRPGDH